MNDLKQEDVMRALVVCAKPIVTSKIARCKQCPYLGRDCSKEFIPAVLAIIREKDKEIERLTKSRNSAVAEREANVKGFAEEVAKLAAERDRHKAESEQYRLETLRRGEEIERLIDSGFEVTDYAIDKIRAARAEGYNQALDDLAERLTKFYGTLKGKTVGGSVEFHVRQIAKEIREGENRDAC